MSTQVHTTRLKERLIEIFPDLITVAQGRDVLLTFDDNVANTLKQAKESHDVLAFYISLCTCSILYIRLPPIVFIYSIIVIEKLSAASKVILTKEVYCTR